MERPRTCACALHGVSFLLLFLLSLHCKVAHGAQQFEKQPEYFEVNPGQEARLTCKIFHKKGQCSWQKDNKPVGIYLGKYEWAGDPDIGDCSIRVLNSVLEYDDGEWECQVTASDFAAQDALTSKPVRLVVRVPPNAPQIEFNGTHIPMGKNLTSQHGLRSSIKCRSRNGNPPPLIKWFVGDEEVLGVNQINKTEDDNPKKWSATSTLDYTFTRHHNGKTLRCVAVHEAYPTKSRETEIVLNVQYAPQVQLAGTPQGDLEEDTDSVTLKCSADSNPPSQIIWRKKGASQVFGYEEALVFKPLVRKHSGTYTCEAKNFLGVSHSTSVDLDVKYPPKITIVGPERMVMASLYNRTVLQCQAEGNPQPTYQWLQQTADSEDSTYVRGSEHMLVIHNVTYDFQGKYMCKATNMISGSERATRSDPIELHVMGAPQVLRHSVESEVETERGSEAKLTVVFCANPPPTKATWEWGSLQLEAGNEVGRYNADRIEKGSRDGCYEARFRITNADRSDSRYYYLKVENSHGFDKYSVNLQVRGFDFVFADPVSMSMVIGVIIGCLVVLVIVVLIILYAFKAEKLCFSEKGDFKPTDLESEKSDLSGSTKAAVNEDHQNGNGTNGGTFATLPKKSDTHFIQQQSRPKATRPPDPSLPPDYHIMKQQQPQTEQNRGRTYSPTTITISTIDPTRNDINYSDLQLPRSSNNGSMKKSRNYKFQHQQPQLLHYHQHSSSQLSRINIPVIQPPHRKSEMQHYKPRYDEQAEV